MNLKEILKVKTVFAFNCDDFVIYRGIVEAIAQTNKPIILQLSSGEVNFWGLERFNTLARQEDLPLFLNIDHGKDLPVIKKAINLGFDMVHCDGSDLPWEENIELSCEVTKLARRQGLLVEGEPQQEWTEPQKAAEFVKKTGVDLVAVFAGNKHGMDPKKPERLDFDRLRAIKQAVGNTLLTLHGGSGVAKDDLKQAIKEKLVAKINVNTQLRFICRRQLEKQLAIYQGNKIYEIVQPIVRAIKEKVIEILKLSINY